ncbi:NAD(+)--rifampin ADP-ribosyltransferase [Streptomyces sp. NPDC020379]|uniref:NAD(+)--rifampin ADP-ribosyltransferase n=1 Tax=Streptomyces sp. NPDC020379 TaxID=3365071 RepID=UPI00378975DA
MTESATVQAAGTPKTYRWLQTVFGENGYEDREHQVRGPLYHGGGAHWREGQQINPGRKVNPWGDEVGKSQHVYFTTQLETAAAYAQQSGGHVFEVEPTGDFNWDRSDTDFKTPNLDLAILGTLGYKYEGPKGHGAAYAAKLLGID